MATVIKNESINCPCCGTYVDVKDIERRGLKNGILIELDNQIRDAILEETFSLARSFRRLMDPSATSLRKKFIQKLNRINGEPETTIEQQKKSSVNMRRKLRRKYREQPSEDIHLELRKDTIKDLKDMLKKLGSDDE